MENLITSDAFIKGLGASSWQKQADPEGKPIVIASRYLNDTDAQYASGEFEILESYGL